METDTGFVRTRRFAVTPSATPTGFFATCIGALGRIFARTRRGGAAAFPRGLGRHDGSRGSAATTTTTISPGAGTDTVLCMGGGEVCRRAVAPGAVGGGVERPRRSVTVAVVGEVLQV